MKNIYFEIIFSFVLNISDSAKANYL